MWRKDDNSYLFLDKPMKRIKEFAEMTDKKNGDAEEKVPFFMKIGVLDALRAKGAAATPYALSYQRFINAVHLCER